MQKGYKITPQRRKIFELLSGDKSHPTAEEIYQRVQSAMPDVSRTTVYNTLRELSVMGELAGLGDLDASGVRYDTNPSAHHHLFCVRCNALADVPGKVEAPELAPEVRAGYRIEKSQIMFYGVCPECQNEETGAGPC